MTTKPKYISLCKTGMGWSLWLDIPDINGIFPLEPLRYALVPRLVHRTLEDALKASFDV